MKVNYFQTSKLRPEELEQELGIKVKSVTIGMIETDEVEEGVDDEGSTVGRTATRSGIQIDFEEEPTEVQLEKLDMRLFGYERDGGKNLIDKMAEIEGKIKALETKEVI